MEARWQNCAFTRSGEQQPKGLTSRASWQSFDWCATMCASQYRIPICPLLCGRRHPHRIRPLVCSKCGLHLQSVDQVRDNLSRPCTGLHDCRDARGAPSGRGMLLLLVRFLPMVTTYSPFPDSSEVYLNREHVCASAHVSHLGASALARSPGHSPPSAGASRDVRGVRQPETAAVEVLADVFDHLCELLQYVTKTSACRNGHAFVANDRFLSKDAFGEQRCW